VTFGNNRIQLVTDQHLLVSFAVGLERDPTNSEDSRDAKRLLQILLRDETFRVNTWLSPVSNDTSVGPVTLDEAGWLAVARFSWKFDPYLAVHLTERFVSPALTKEIRRLVMANPEDVIKSPLAAQILLRESLSPALQFQLKVFTF
jgi:phosphatidylinositol 4-kinase A